MKKYIVGLANIYNGENELHIVEASNSIEAMKKVLEVDEDFANIEEVKQYAHDGDYLISEPLEIE